MTFTAEFDDTRTYRFLLGRELNQLHLTGTGSMRLSGNAITFLMLNPSTADEFTNDRTVAKCQKMAQRWGFSQLWVVNLSPYQLD